MRVDLSLDRPGSRSAAVGVIAVMCGWLLYVVLCDFFVGALADERIPVTADATPNAFITAPFRDDRIGVNPDVLASARRYFSNSSRLHTRLADYERHELDDGWRASEADAVRAVKLSPYDSAPLLLLASIQEAKGDFETAKNTTREALKMVPYNLDAHWQLAVLLLNTGDLGGALEEFRVAASGHTAYLDAALQLVWSEAEDPEALAAITPDTPSYKLRLANFLLSQSRPLESATTFRQIDRDALLRDPNSAAYLNGLIAAGQVKLAHELWCGLKADINREEESTNVIWNGGFESDILVDFAQFDWSIHPSNFARISIDNATVRTGNRSLRIDFIGRETTRLGEEIKQLTLFQPGARYRLRYYVKTEDLVAPESPRVVVSGASSRETIGASDPAPAASTDWQPRTLEFTAPEPALTVRIEQEPRFSYEDPSHGTIWFDDFEIREIQ